MGYAGRKRAEIYGFTLAELFIALGVTAVLMALLLPTLGVARSRGRQAACLNNLVQLHKTFMMYAADNEGLLPPYQNEVSGGQVSINNRPYTVSTWRSDLFVSALRPYTHSGGLWFCPDDPDAHTHHGSFGSDHFDTSYKVPFEVGLEGYPATANGYGVPDPIPQVLLEDCDQRGYSHNGSFNRLYFDGHADSYRFVSRQNG